MEMEKNNSLHIKTNARVFRTPNQNIAFYIGKTKADGRLHQHEFFELFLATDEKIQHIFNGTTTVLEPGTLCLISPNDTHNIVCHQNKTSFLFDLKIKPHLFEALCFAVDDTLFEYIKNTDAYLSYQLKPDELSHVKKIIDTAHLIPERKADTTVQPLLRTLAVTFLFYLYSASQEKPKNYPQWFGAFLDILNTPDSFAKPLSELYERSTYSQRQLNTYFRKYMGTTIVAYMAKQKINYACNLLRTTNHTIIYIASLAGYATLGRFNTIFKKQMGLSPSEYRKQFRAE